jgi:hypothetical protein
VEALDEAGVHYREISSDTIEANLEGVELGERI